MASLAREVSRVSFKQKLLLPLVTKRRRLYDSYRCKENPLTFFRFFLPMYSKWVEIPRMDGSEAVSISKLINFFHSASPRSRH
jgi:hypothetical protein